MEAIERKYARVDAKINYKTFTSKMRSWNSSNKESASRAEWARHWNRKLDNMEGIFAQGLPSQGTFIPHSFFFFFWQIFIGTSHIPIFKHTDKVTRPKPKFFFPLWLVPARPHESQKRGLPVIPEAGAPLYGLPQQQLEAPAVSSSREEMHRETDTLMPHKTRLVGFWRSGNKKCLAHNRL